MHIDKINNIQFTRTHLPQLNKENNTNTSNPIKEFNPPYYKDYNVSFSARLFRTPANFFEQEFNRNGMPDTMKNYLFDDYEDRQNMPPAQMMKLVFSDINEAHNLDEVKKLYPEEKLFANLKDVSSIKSRTGVLAEIDLMKQADKSLFKNGQDNLGLYILKKIYIEGKTLKEINKDFQKDISVYYKGVSPIDYRTLSAFGIKFPKIAFWNSFVATREDFPYEYKPRKSVMPRGTAAQTKTTDVTNSKNTSPKKKFDNIKDWEIDKISDAMISGYGDVAETQRQLKKRNIKDGVNDTFVMKYLGEINTVVLEKVHASDEMKDFWANYDDKSASQRAKMEAYWHSDPQIKEFRSQAMKDTIKLFMDAYGVDGNNEEFQDLLLYARSIKPKRLEQARMHAEKQAYYDEIFADFATEEPKAEQAPEVEKVQIPFDVKSASKLLHKLANENNAEIITLQLPTGKTVEIACNVNEEFSKILRSEMKLLPKRFQERYLRFMLQSPHATDNYKKSVILAAKLPNVVPDGYMAPEDFRNVSMEVNKDFQTKYPQVLLASDQAVAMRLLSSLPDSYAEILMFNTSHLLNFATETLNVNEWSPEDLNRLNSDFEKYCTPIKNKSEIKAINNILMDYITNFEPKSGVSTENDAAAKQLLNLLSANMRKYPAIKSLFAKSFRQSTFLDFYGGSAKLLLEPDVSKAVKDVKCQLMLEDYLLGNINSIGSMLCCDRNNILLYLQDPDLKQIMLRGNLYY